MGTGMRHVLVLGALVMLAGCSTSVDVDGGAGDGASSPAPWAEELALAAEKAASEEERDALLDGSISPQEYAYFQQRIVDCLEDHGVDARFRDDGALEYTNRDAVAQEVIDRCNWDNGLRLIALRDAMLRNPDHLEPTAIMLECLKRVGLVPETYTRAELEAGIGLEAVESTDDFAGCAADPLHHGLE